MLIKPDARPRRTSGSGTWLLLAGFGLASLGQAGCSARPPHPPVSKASAQVESAPPRQETADPAADDDRRTELAWEFLARVDEAGLIQPQPDEADDQTALSQERNVDFPLPPERTPPPFDDIEASQARGSGSVWNSPGSEEDDVPPLPSLGPRESEPESSWLAWVPGLSDEPAAANGNGRYRVEHDLLSVVGPFQRLANKDTYRYPLPKDATGASVHKATLVRLRDYETQRPGAYPAIVAFTRGRAYEALHAYDQALMAYQRVAQGKTRFKDQAAQAVEALTAFEDLKQRTPGGTTPVEYLQALDELGEQWRALVRRYAGTPYEALAREEEEHLDRAKVAFIEINRHRIEDGNESVILAYQQLLDKHRDSKHRYRYRLELGDFYVALAHEYAAQYDPESLRFDRQIFERLGQAALQHYAAVAQQDGTIEKLEAKGKLESLQAYMARVGRLGR